MNLPNPTNPTLAVPLCPGQQAHGAHSTSQPAAIETHLNWSRGRCQRWCKMGPPKSRYKWSEKKNYTWPEINNFPGVKQRQTYRGLLLHPNYIYFVWTILWLGSDMMNHLERFKSTLKSVEKTSTWLPQNLSTNTWAFAVPVFSNLTAGFHRNPIMIAPKFGDKACGIHQLKYLLWSW